MRALIRAGIAAVLLLGAFGFIGCAGASKPAVRCEQCKNRAKPGEAAAASGEAYCVVNGKPVDCRKTPPECPDCAKPKS